MFIDNSVKLIVFDFQTCIQLAGICCQCGFLHEDLTIQTSL